MGWVLDGHIGLAGVVPSVRARIYGRLAQLQRVLSHSECHFGVQQYRYTPTVRTAMGVCDSLRFFSIKVGYPRYPQSMYRKLTLEAGILTLLANDCIISSVLSSLVS